MTKRLWSLFLLLCICSKAVFSQGLDFRIGEQRIYYHLLKTKESHERLLIFLHGSVAAYKEKTESILVGTEELLEGNAALVPFFNARGYDILIPVAFGEFNWLDPKGTQVIEQIFREYGNTYKEIYIAGFSDGGTGAYRYFYSQPDRYRGLIVFNGYPQLQNFYRKVDYKNNTTKPVIFHSQYQDKVVPYEFLLTEYRRQKMCNPHCYFRINEGRHEFIRYSEADFALCETLLRQVLPEKKNSPDSLWIYPAPDAYMYGDSIVEIYSFRTKTAKQYGMKKEEYQVEQVKNTQRIYPVYIARKDITQNKLNFPAEQNGKSVAITLPNFLSFSAW